MQSQGVPEVTIDPFHLTSFFLQFSSTPHQGFVLAYVFTNCFCYECHALHFPISAIAIAIDCLLFSFPSAVSNFLCFVCQITGSMKKLHLVGTYKYIFSDSPSSPITENFSKNFQYVYTSISPPIGE